MYPRHKLPDTEARSYSQVQWNLIEVYGLIKRGWCQGRAQKPARLFGLIPERHCALGALSKVLGTEYFGTTTPEFEALRMAVAQSRSEIPVCARTIADWNDEAGRTKAEVLDMIEVAVEFAR